MAEEDRSSAPQKINEAIALFREYGHPVIRVYHSDPKRGPEPDTEPFEFPDSIAITDEDAKIIKGYPSAFTKTDLEEILREDGRNTVFLCGLSAMGCVLATYFGAMEREFTVLMVQDALLSCNASYGWRSGGRRSMRASGVSSPSTSSACSRGRGGSGDPG